MNRRQFIVSTLTAAATARTLAAGLGDPRFTVEPGRMFIRDCPFPGDTRADDVFPAHPNGMRLAKNRFLILYATRGWRGTDDDLSIAYQVRADRYDGPVLNEGRVATASDDWDALGDGKSYKMSHGAPTGFGVPKGGIIGGKPAAHANLFVAKWYKYAREFEGEGRVRSGTETEDLSRRTAHVQWMQFRLNDADDNIEILQAPDVLRRPGAGAAQGLVGSRLGTNQSFVSPSPFNDSATEWVDIHRFEDEHRWMAPIKFRYDPSTRRYACVEVGQPLWGPEHTAFEAGIVQLPDGDWAVCARDLRKPALWIRSSDPFGKKPGKVYATPGPDRPMMIAPVTTYRCADGKVRLLSGDIGTSPYQKPRDPLYCWDIDPARDFAHSNRRVVFDGRKSLPEVRPEAYVMADMAKLLPHTGGNSQLVLHRVRTWSINHEVPGKGPALLPREKPGQGIYCARFDYDQAYPDAWRFA